MQTWVLGLLLLLGMACSGPIAAEYQPQDGDLLFHTSTSAQSAAIQQATHSPYSHMGVLLFRDGQPWVLEAVQPVRWTRLAQWTARGKQGHYTVRRLRTPLSPAQVQKLHAAALPFLGKPYDALFGWGDDRIYCSELAWKLYHQALGIELAPLGRLRDFDLRASAVRAKLNERYGPDWPLDESVIAPSAIFDSPLLTTVH